MLTILSGILPCFWVPWLLPLKTGVHPLYTVIIERPLLTIIYVSGWSLAGKHDPTCGKPSQGCTLLVKAHNGPVCVFAQARH